MGMEPVAKLAILLLADHPQDGSLYLNTPLLPSLGRGGTSQFMMKSFPQSIFSLVKGSPVTFKNCSKLRPGRTVLLLFGDYRLL